MNRLPTLLLLATLACAPPIAPSGAPSPTVPPSATTPRDATARQAPAPAPRGDRPQSVILMIGDGTGLEYWSAAKIMAEQPLAIEAFPIIGLVDTQSSDSRVTDSAAGATAYSAGVRTFNGAIGVGPDSVSVPTVLERAEELGLATGLVSTSTVTHATPAAFASHVVNRNMYFEIARQMAEHEIDVLFGGGRRYFRADSRPDGEDLRARLEKRGTYLEDPTELERLDPDTVRTITGLFAENQPAAARKRAPTLAALTDVALDVLEEDPDGFFLMVEGSQIDWRGHDNAPLDEVLAEVMDFDAAIRRVLQFQARRPNTLVIVVADHSTGGLAVHPDRDGVYRAHYTTEGHTAGMVPLFAGGPSSAVFAGVMDNDRVGRLLLQVVTGEEAPAAASGVITETHE